MILMMAAGLFSHKLGAGAALILLVIFPGYSVWCGFGALIALFAPKPLDRAALGSNLVVGVLTAIPFVLISMDAVHVHF
jgi:hypothetical protein